MRFRTALFPVLLLAPTAAGAQAPCWGAPGGGAVRLTVESVGVRSGAGEIAVTIFPDRRERFLARGAKLARVRAPAAAPVTTTCFWLKPGWYPVAVYHDENGDRDFNRTVFAPREGFGFSNDPPTMFGVPSFAKVRFQVGPGDTSVRIRMKYPR